MFVNLQSMVNIQNAAGHLEVEPSIQAYGPTLHVWLWVFEPVLPGGFCDFYCLLLKIVPKYERQLAVRRWRRARKSVSQLGGLLRVWQYWNNSVESQQAR